MHVFLMWSGGLDSTALLYANLKLGHRVTTLEYTRSTSTTEIEFLLDITNRKIDAELKARDAIAARFKEEFPYVSWSRKTTEYPILSNHLLRGVKVRSWLQPWTHLFQAIRFMDNEDVLQLGYVPGDSVTETWNGNAKSGMEYLQQVWEAYQMCSRDPSCRVSLKVPFLDPEDHRGIVNIVGNTKADFIRLLPDYILDHFHTCETPDENADSRWCGSCNPCRTMFVAVNQLSEEEVLEKIESLGIITSQQLNKYIKEGLESWRK